MKDAAENVRGWLRKAASDLRAAEGCQQSGALDAACFHAQQAAEKSLKAYLTHHRIDFPMSHNLTKLVLLCKELDTTFQSILDVVEPLTPYAVEVRYDADFWPPPDTADQARAAAEHVRRFVFDRLPPSMTSTL